MGDASLEHDTPNIPEEARMSIEVEEEDEAWNTILDGLALGSCSHIKALPLQPAESEGHTRDAIETALYQS